ncbi:MAG TPA: sulfatase-like hydrolase/transferase [Terriglobia bacterium]|nr:sulfatase-like hydrolase/transferase [Terriglobia bacterium]
MARRIHRRIKYVVWIGLTLIPSAPLNTARATDPTRPVAEAPPPSVVLITLDTVRADHLGCYGSAAAKTPAVDGLAHEAVRFANAYTVVPITLPSHAVILTGTYPMWNGVRDFTSPGLPAGIPTLAEMLKRNGYATAAFVSAYAVNSVWGLNRGFDLYDDQMDLGGRSGHDLMLATRPGNLTTDRMIAWLDAHSERPFFIWLHLYDAHSPYHSPEPYRSQHAGQPYDAAISFDDAQVGRVLGALRAKRLYEQTLVIVTSDHGESLGEHGEAEHGFFVYNATLRVPLIVKWPGRKHDGAVVVQEPVSTIDISSTIAQAAGIPASGTRSFQGKALTRAIEPHSASPNSVQPLYAESYYARDSFGWHELRAVITEQYKYIDAPAPEVYDLKHDPQEVSDLFSEHRALAASLRADLVDVERRFENRANRTERAQLDPATVEKLKSLGYVAYQASTTDADVPSGGADPKEEIGTFNQILHADDLRRAGKYAEAAQLLGDLLRREPRLYILPFEVGENDLAWGKPREAIGKFRAALQLNPLFDQAALGLGRAYFEIGQDSEAANALEIALGLNPRNFLARLALAKVYFRENDLDKAESALAQVANEQPGFAEGHADYGVVLARKGDYAEAKSELERGAALGYRDANSLNFLGVARAELGETDKAIEAYQEALKLDPQFAAANLNLALEYRRLGNASEASRYYHKLCESNERLCQQYAAQFADK